MSYIMTNQYVFDSGKIIDIFNYIHPNDIDGEYIGYLVEFNNSVYEIIKHQRDGILNPDDTAELISDNLDSIYDYIDEINEKPLNIKNNIDESIEHDDGLIIEDGKIFFNGRLIEPIYDDIEEDYNEYIDNSNETNTSRFDEFGNKYYH